MVDRQRLIRHCKVLALLCAWVFLALSLAGYNPSDTPGSAAEPPNSPPANPCGPVGAALAHAMFGSVGWASYLILWALAAADLLLFRRRVIPEKGARLLGFALVIVVTSALVQRFDPALQPGPAIGSGGYLGALTIAFLGGQFGPVGMFLILLTAGVVGVAFCYDALFLWPVQELIRTAWRGRRAYDAHGMPAAIESPRLKPAGAIEFNEPEVPRIVTGAPGPVAHHSSDRDGLNGSSKSMEPVTGLSLGSRSPVSGHTNPNYELPPPSLLEPPPPFPYQEHEAKIHSRALLLEKTLLEFGYQVRV